ncbi:hypothetical protein NEILACOT_05267 [Neisseria lactamica ATCC 23970]|uniref:Uncharacterized protein n=1 Tax=Neisseria lactamica ATCC 23970 TaxID=546265 RepID=D0WCI5_NEILA|nr:hypothetical protein NEILACOT_05267 [Neisseria lactamica ATCC 23970]
MNPYSFSFRSATIKITLISTDNENPYSFSFRSATILRRGILIL